MKAHKWGINVFSYIWLVIVKGQTLLLTIRRVLFSDKILKKELLLPVHH